MNDLSRNGRQITDRIGTGAMGPGWVPLLIRLHTHLTALAPDYRLEEFDAEFGRLRLQVADTYDADGEFDGIFADEAAALIDAAVLASQRTCEDCGAEGRARFRGDGQRTWIRTLCDYCRTPRDADQDPAAADTHPYGVAHGGEQ